MADNQKKPLRFKEEITVRGAEPPELDPDKDFQSYPANMQEIYLGTETARPTGTFTPEDLSQVPAPNVDPRIKPVWDKVVARHPYAATFVDDVVVEPEFMGTGHRAEFDANRGDRRRRINFREDAIDEETLLHELTHGAMNAAFLDPEAEQDHYNGPTPWDYWSRRGERVARKTAWDSQDAAQDALKKALGGQ